MQNEDLYIHKQKRSGYHTCFLQLLVNNNKKEQYNYNVHKFVFAHQLQKMSPRKKKDKHIKPSKPKYTNSMSSEDMFPWGRDGIMCWEDSQFFGEFLLVFYRWLQSCTHKHTCMHTHTHTQARTHARARAHTHTHTHPRTHAHMHAHTHTNMHACTHTHIHTHTHHFITDIPVLGEMHYIATGKVLEH